MILYVLTSCFIFFFKQKTAYEMRISDWSSDVCSSDLCDPAGRAAAEAAVARLAAGGYRVIAVAAGPVTEPEAESLDGLTLLGQIGRASCRERVCQYV